MNEKYGKRYDEAFKREAVSMVVDGKVPYTRVAGQLGIGEETLRRWIVAFHGQSSDEPEQSDKQRIRALERENAQLKMERDILKEAVGIFSQRPK